MNLRQQLKFTAKGFLAGGKPSPLLVGLAALALTTLLNFLDTRIAMASVGQTKVAQAYSTFLETGNYDRLVSSISQAHFTFSEIILGALISLMGLMIAVGVVIYVISEVRYHKGSYGNLFDGMPLLLRVLWYQIYTSILIALWSLLFVIPGVIAAYRYRQGLYILLDHPEMSVVQCVKASKNMMDGHKSELFVLDLSFMGWTIGLSFAQTLLIGALGPSSIMPMVLVMPLAVFIRMYTEITYFLYYEHLHGVHYDSRIPNTAPTIEG